MADLAAAMDRRRLVTLLSPAYLWLLVAVFLPLSAMLFFSLLTDLPQDAPDWGLTLDNYGQFLTNPTYATLLWKSLKLGVMVTLACILIGYPCALVLARTIRGRARETLFLLVILPFWSNSLVRIFSWAIVLRGNGVLERSLDWLLPFDIRLNLMFTTPAVVIGLVHSYLPYVILTSYLALQAIDDDIIEAARSMGASRWTILRRLLLPLSLPGLLAGAVLVFVPVVGSFMEPRILGGRMGTYYGTVIEDQFIAVYNWPLGAALSFILLAVVLLIIALASPVLKRART
ncbi:ABC transporter permease [Salipiger marinus]|uniref:Spermidine/putrescine transport system permease protein n=1 Tax=Salipiger marinus TaxID=555512 RepID=A0A1G8LWP1_9RHOB|nr:MULTISPECIES: ABC transporter permease [Salipiger]MEB3420122.1 ABC transporter permease [Salipiger manganoxidans]SDI60078.1 spermidine/putrescine transport system permease protein [Salipiger marinus]HBT02356.1 ABC transporter permease [Citreicella sp.]